MQPILVYLQMRQAHSAKMLLAVPAGHGQKQYRYFIVPGNTCLTKLYNQDPVNRTATYGYTKRTERWFTHGRYIKGTQSVASPCVSSKCQSKTEQEDTIMMNTEETKTAVKYDTADKMPEFIPEQEFAFIIDGLIVLQKGRSQAEAAKALREQYNR